MNAKMAKACRRYTRMLTGGKVSKIRKTMKRLVASYNAEQRGSLRVYLNASVDEWKDSRKLGEEDEK